MKYRIIYLVVQLILLLVPAIFATIRRDTNNYITNSFSEFMIYVSGISGILPLAIISEVLELIIPESFSSLISIGVYVFVTSYVFLWAYQPRIKRLIFVSLVNIWLAVWSVIFGDIFMLLSMQ